MSVYKQMPSSSFDYENFKVKASLQVAICNLRPSASRMLFDKADKHWSISTWILSHPSSSYITSYEVFRVTHGSNLPLVSDHRRGWIVHQSVWQRFFMHRELWKRSTQTVSIESLQKWESIFECWNVFLSSVGEFLHWASIDAQL